MNARHELAREAERILLDAGCASANAKHWGPWWTVNGMRADEREVSGHTRDQADPQDPRDLARRLAAQLAVKPEPEDIPAAPETVEDTFPQGEGPFDLQPEASETPQDETHGETGEEADGAEGNSHVHADGLDEAELHADVGVGDAESGASDFGSEVILEADADRPECETLDADFTLDTIELIEPSEPDFGRELLEFEDELAAEPERAADASGAFIFGDNLHQMRTAAIGLVSTHAAILTAEIETASGEQEGEYADLQSFVVTNLDKHTGAFTLQDAPSLMRYHRWSELDAMRAAVRTIDRVRKEKTAFLLSAERAEIEAFDPSEGWP